MSNSYQKEQVVHIVNSVLEKVRSSSEISKEAIYQELEELKRIIDDARSGIGSAQAGDITGKHIPTATDELDAVVEATAEATGSIMDACEAIEGHVSSLDAEQQGKVMDEITKIYEACTFQDITGQRITKVVRALRDIESKVSHLLTVLGEKLPGLGEDSGEGATLAAGQQGTQQGSVEPQGDEALLNGPQMADEAISQDDIDKLLASFD